MNLRNNFIKVITLAVIILIVCLAAGCTSAPSHEGLKITNSDGTTTVLPGEAQRIALLNSNAGEVLFLIDEAHRIVGISDSIAKNKEQSEMYPNAEIIGSWDNPNVESLISLKVDLVIGYATSKPKNAEVLKASGIPIVYIDCTKPETMASDIREVGKIVGNEKWAENVADFFTETINNVTTEAKKYSSSPKVYAESYSEYYGQGKGTGLDQIINLAGGTNIMESIDGARKISEEWVVSEKPEVIIKLVNSMDNKENVQKSVIQRTGFDTTPAVINNNVWIIRNDLTYGPRASIGALAILKILHPEALPGVTPQNMLKELNDKFGYTFDTENITYPEII